MSEELEFVGRAVLIGIGATVISDLWAALLRRLFGVPSANWSLVGRWFGHFPRGRFVHENIAKAPPVRGELAIGWGVHYGVGIVFAALLLAIWGLDWARRPVLLPALVVGVLTVVAPFFMMQPGMGAGIAASKTPKPNEARLRSLVAHTVFGLGLYGSALFWAALIHP